MNPPRFFLQRIELSNYRCFKHLTVDFDERLTVLIARNGLGKTAVLDAISIAFGPFIGSFHTGKNNSISQTDVRLRLTNPQLQEMEPQYPASIVGNGVVELRGLEIQDEVYDFKSLRLLKSAKSNTTMEGNLQWLGQAMQVGVTSNWPVVLPLVAYYGTGRLWKQKKKTAIKIIKAEISSRTSGYQDCLDPASSYLYVEDWIKHATLADTQGRERRSKKEQVDFAEAETAYTPLLLAVQEAVDECLKSTGWHGLHYSFVFEALVVEHPQHGFLAVSQLSDGVRNMIGLVADIAYRAVRLNSRFGQQAPKQTPGLVLIDEVDMHLHPEWQQIILTSLTSAFPALQFIVTTHSPQVLTTVKREQVRLLSENIEGDAVAAIPTGNTYGRSNADVLQAVMAVSPEPTVPESRELSEYMALVEQGDWRSDDARRLRRKLSQQLGEDYPWLVRADMIMHRREALER